MADRPLDNISQERCFAGDRKGGTQDHIIFLSMISQMSHINVEGNKNISKTISVDFCEVKNFMYMNIHMFQINMYCKSQT